MAWFALGGAAISVVGGAIASNKANKAAKGAADAQSASQQKAIDEQRRQYDQTRSDLAPYMQFGQQGTAGIGKLNNGDYSGFLNSPDYLAASQQGIGQLDKSAAARGSLFSGGHERDLMQFNQQNASQYLGNYRNSLFQQAGMGQSSAAGVGYLGSRMADQVGNSYGNMGNAQAGSLLSQGANNSQFAAGVGGTLNGLLQQRAATGSSYAPPTGLGAAGMNYGQGGGSWMNAPTTSTAGGSWFNGYGSR
jgi:hypothetical protein